MKHQIGAAFDKEIWVLDLFEIVKHWEQFQASSGDDDHAALIRAWIDRYVRLMAPRWRNDCPAASAALSEIHQCLTFAEDQTALEHLKQILFSVSGEVFFVSDI